MRFVYRGFQVFQNADDEIAIVQPGYDQDVIITISPFQADQLIEAIRTVRDATIREVPNAIDHAHSWGPKCDGEESP